MSFKNSGQIVYLCPGIFFEDLGCHYELASAAYEVSAIADNAGESTAETDSGSSGYFVSVRDGVSVFRIIPQIVRIVGESGQMPGEHRNRHKVPYPDILGALEKSEFDPKSGEDFFKPPERLRTTLREEA